MFGKFEYCCVRTSEGHDVLHTLYRGCFIPIAWIRHAWHEIHRAFEVWITRVDDRKGGIGGISRYLVTQYMSNQSGYVRGSASALDLRGRESCFSSVAEAVRVCWWSCFLEG